MPVVPYNDWCDEATYMDEMARMHKLTPKLDIIKIMREQFESTKSKQQFSTEQRNWLLTHLSGQIFALSMELTDDLAAVCLAYLKSLSKKNKLVIEYIAKTKMGAGHDFYKNASNNPDYAAEAAGLDITSSKETKENLRKRFDEIKQMRDKFWDWYTGYKHGQYATPIVLTATDPKGTQIQEWGLYLIPRSFHRDKIQGKIHTEDRFINTVGNIDLFLKLAEDTVQLWVEARDRQYPKVFGRSLL